MSPDNLKSSLAGLGFVTVEVKEAAIIATIRTSKHSVETARKRARERLSDEGAEITKGADCVIVSLSR